MECSNTWICLEVQTRVFLAFILDFESGTCLAVISEICDPVYALVWLDCLFENELKCLSNRLRFAIHL